METNKVICDAISSISMFAFDTNIHNALQAKGRVGTITALLEQHFGKEVARHFEIVANITINTALKRS